MQDNQRLQLPNRFSTAVSELSASSPGQGGFPQGSSNTSDRQSYAGSVSSHPSSYDQGNGMASPGLDKRSFVAELPANDSPAQSWPPKSPNLNGTPGQQYQYNPQDYGRMS